MTEHLPIILWRVVPTVLFLGLAVPLYLRVLRGVIPVDPAEGMPHEIRRADSPTVFRRWAVLYVGIAVVVTAWFIIAWCTRPSLAS